MTNCKVLLLGSSGFLGSKIVEVKPKGVDLYLSGRIESSQIQIDLTNLNSFKKTLEKIKPKFIIHAARINPFENDPIKAKEITTKLVKILKPFHTKLVYISSDAVFDGKKGNYTEDDTPNPITDYGRAKLAAENAIRKNLSNYIIIRTASIYGQNNGIWDKRSIALHNEIKSEQPVKRFIDMYRSFTLVDDLANACWQLINTNFKGIINIAGPKKSFYQFSQEIAKKLNVNPNLIKPDSLKGSGLNIAPDTSLKFQEKWFKHQIIRT